MRSNKRALRAALRELSATKPIDKPMPVLTESQGRALRYNGENPNPPIKNPCRLLGGSRKPKRASGVVAQLEVHPLLRPRLSFRKKYQQLEALVNPPKPVRILTSFGKYVLTTTKG